MVKTILIGHIGNDCTVRDVNDKKAISFSVAHSEKWADKDAVLHEKTTWFNCVIWRKNGQSTEISKYLKKGEKVYIEGKPDAKLYNDKEGVARIDHTIVVNQLELVSSKPKDSNGQSNNAAKGQTATQTSNQTQQQEGSQERYISDDDLPF